MKPELEKILSTLSLNELVSTKNEIQDLITSQQENEKSRLLESFKKMSEEAGLDLADVVVNLHSSSTTTNDQASRKRNKARPKYQNPDNGNQTWTGRGRKPLWVAEFLANNGWKESEKEAGEDEKTANKATMTTILEKILIEQV